MIGIRLSTDRLIEPSVLVLDWFYEEVDVLPTYVVDGLLALGVIFLAWLVGKAIIRYAARPVARRFERPSVTRAILQVIRAIVLFVGIAFAAAIVGFAPGDILLSVTVLTGILAVLLAPVARRFIGGMFVLADQPYEIGDMIEIADTDTRGFVEDVTLRYTKLFTLENTFIVVPNSEILNRDIVNYSAEDKRTRQELIVEITYEGDLEEAQRRIEAAAASIDGVIEGGPSIRIGSTRYPAEPVCQIHELGDDGVILRLRYWINEPYYLSRLRSEVQEAILEELDDAPVAIAYPHSHLIFDDTSGQLDISIDRDRPD